MAENNNLKNHNSVNTSQIIKNKKIKQYYIILFLNGLRMQTNYNDNVSFLINYSISLKWETMLNQLSRPSGMWVIYEITKTYS